MQKMCPPKNVEFLVFNVTATEIIPESPFTFIVFMIISKKNDQHYARHHEKCQIFNFFQLLFLGLEFVPGHRQTLQDNP